MFAWWICLSFQSMQDLIAAMSVSPAFMTQNQADAAKIVNNPEYGDYLIFQSDLYATNGPAKQEFYIANAIRNKTGINSETCSAY